MAECIALWMSFWSSLPLYLTLKLCFTSDLGKKIYNFGHSDPTEALFCDSEVRPYALCSMNSGEKQPRPKVLEKYHC